MAFDKFYDFKSEDPSPDPPPAPRMKMKVVDPGEPAEPPPPPPTRTPAPDPLPFPSSATFTVTRSHSASGTFQLDSRTLLLGGLAVAVLALVVTMVVQPRGESVRAIRNNPERFEGRSVMVRGKVGEVFPMGASCAYNLHQGWSGKDTIVVFSRVRTPLRGNTLAIHGSVSTGFLDGQPRPAIFEIAQ